MYVNLFDTQDALWQSQAVRETLLQTHHHKLAWIMNVHIILARTLLKKKNYLGCQKLEGRWLDLKLYIGKSLDQDLYVSRKLGLNTYDRRLDLNL